MAVSFKGKIIVLLGVVLGVAALGSDLASADVLLNINLSGSNPGDPVPTGPSSNPVTQFGVFSGYGTPTGSALVQNVSGIGNAAVLTSDPANAEVGAEYLDTGFNFTAPHLLLSFDINVLNQSAGGYGQTVDNGATPLLFGVRLYSPSANNWSSTFNLAPTSANGGNLGFRDATNSTLQNFGTYTTGTAEHVAIDVNYLTGTEDAYLNGNLVYSGYPLRGGIQSAPVTSELFIYMNGNTQQVSNSVAIGNVEIQSVPLPTSVYMGLGLLTAFGVTRWYRARYRTRHVAGV